MARRPNVVFLVLDSVRYDHTSVGDHYRDTTPNIQRVADAEDGVSFDLAISHAKHTSKSSASILTGTYPSQHRFGYESNALNSEVPTVAELFRNAGYDTACVSNNSFVSEETGLDRGFEDFTLLPRSPLDILRTVGPLATLRFLANIRHHSAGFQRDTHRHSGAYLTTALIRQQLDRLENESDPFFLYAHYNQPHRAYYPPLAWFETYSDVLDMSPHDAGEFAMDVHHNLTEKVAKGCPFSDDEWAALKALYDTEIKYTDTFVGELCDLVREKFDDTIFVVTADHGEHFGEHGALAHRYVLDDALLHVPLVTSGLDVPSASAPVQHADVMRTLLEEAGAESSSVEGVDLREEDRSFAVSQDSSVSLEEIFDINPSFDATKFFPGADREIPERSSLRDEQYRYVRAVDGSEALYEVSDEETNVTSDRDKVASEFATALDEWFDSHDTIATGDVTGDALSEGTKDRLQEMGYLEGDL